MRRVLFLLAAACLFFASTGAFAHTFLDHSTPEPDAKLTSPPQALVLVFTEALEGDEVKIALFDSGGHQLASNADKDVALKEDTVTIPLAKLAPGEYRVTWFVKSHPGHQTKGDYRFKIQ